MRTPTKRPHAPGSCSPNTTDTPKATCPVCVEDVQDDSEAVSCDKCDFWFHRICGKINEKLYKKIQSAPLNKPIEWICQICTEQIKQTETLPLDPPKNTTNSKNNINNDRVLRTDNTNLTTSNQDPSSKAIAPLTTPMPKDSLIKALESENQTLQSTIEHLNEDLQNLTLQLTAAKKENIRLNQETILKGEKIAELYNHIKNIHSTNKKSDHDTPLKHQPTTNQNETISDNVEHVAEQPKHEETDTDTLIIGDSIIRNIKQYTQHRPTSNVKIHCMPGARIQTLSKYLSTLQTLPPTVIIHIGTNNLAYSKTPNDVMRPLWYTLESAQKKFPNTIWIVNGIIYRRDIPVQYIEQVNEALRFMCDNLHLVYRDPNEEVTIRGIGRDGLHLNHIGDNQLANFILEDIGLKPTTTSTKDKSNNIEPAERTQITTNKTSMDGPPKALPTQEPQKNSVQSTGTTP